MSRLGGVERFECRDPARDPCVQRVKDRRAYRRDGRRATLAPSGYRGFTGVHFLGEGSVACCGGRQCHIYRCGEIPVVARRACLLYEGPNFSQ